MFMRWSDFDRTFAALDDFRRRMDRIYFDHGQRAEDDHRLASQTAWPRMQLRDHGNQLLLYAEVPGLSDDEIQLSLNQNVLTLSGERKAPTKEGYTTHRQERGSFAFSRSFSLPCPIDPEKAGATVKDGILTVTLEKATEAKPRQITVKAS